MSTIKINNDSLRIRPSAVEGFYSCAYQWAKQHLEGHSSIPNSRALIGTAIHKGVEVMWQDAISSGKKDANVSMMADAAIEEWKEVVKQDGIKLGDKETENSCQFEIVNGVNAFVEDIVPFSDIPVAVEKFYEVKLDHPIMDSIGGTIDYITNDTIADVKTSKRKTGADGHVVQQSIYKYLAVANNIPVEHNLIQQVVLKKEPEGAILQLEPNIPYAKSLVNGILDTLDIVHQDIVPIEYLFRGNPKHMFCSEKFCAFYNSCPYSKGKISVEDAIAKVKL